MRVIAGKYKGRKLETVADKSVRPATDKVKGAIFNVLQSRVDWTQAKVLDLYAGSGSIGIEALSRGARQCVFVEKSRSALQFLKANIENVGAGSDAVVIAGDVDSFIASVRSSYAVVFADPPYAMESLTNIPNTVFEKRIVAENGYLIIEHPARYNFAVNGLWEAAVEKVYGNTAVTFFRHKLSAP